MPCFFYLSSLTVLVGLQCSPKRKWLRKVLASKPSSRSKSNPNPQVYRPKSEKDCPCCQSALAHGIPLSSECQHAPLVAWGELRAGNINTAFVERANLTIRQSVSKLARRTWASAQYSSELFEHIYWWLAYYHFSRYQSSL